jgi:hypothetical protein
MTVESGVSSLPLGILGRQAAYRNDDGATIHRSQSSGDFVSVHIGHSNIKQDQIRLHNPRYVSNRFATSHWPNLVTHKAQESRQRVPTVTLIVCYKNS